VQRELEPGASLLAAGTYCLVADQYSGALNGSLASQLMRRPDRISPDNQRSSKLAARTPRPRRATRQPKTGANTSDVPSQVKSLSANTCTGTAFDPVLYVRRRAAPTGMQ
jgi:hypothetical protein